MAANGSADDWAEMEKDILAGAPDTPKTKASRESRETSLRAMPVTRFLEGNLPMIDAARRLSEDLWSEDSRRGSLDSSELNEEIRKARAEYDGSEDDDDEEASEAFGSPASGSSVIGSDKPRRKSSKKTGGKKKKIVKAAVEVGTSPPTLSQMDDNMKRSTSSVKLAKRTSKSYDTNSGFEPVSLGGSSEEDTPDPVNRRRSLQRVKSLDGRKKGSIEGKKKMIMKDTSRTSLSPPPALALPPPPLELPCEEAVAPLASPASSIPIAIPKSGNFIVNKPLLPPGATPPGTPPNPSFLATSPPTSAPPPVPPGLPPALSSEIPTSLPTPLSADELGDIAALPPPPPPIDGLVDGVGSNGKKPSALKRRKSMPLVKGDKVAKKKVKPTEGPEGNPKNRPRLLTNAIRLTREMFDDPKSIDTTYFTFDAKDTEASTNYDDEENDDYNPDYPAVRSAILEKLIVGLTPETYSDPDFIYSFLLSYRTVTTPDILLQLLQLRWNTPAPQKGVDLADFQKKKLTPIRLRIFNLLKLWVEEHYRDFEKDQNAQELLQSFINDVLAKDMPSAAPTLLKIMRSGIEGAPAQEQLQFDSKPPRPYIPMNLKGQLTVLDLHPEEVARQITLIDQGLYRQIRPREFLGNGWSKSDKEVRSPGIIQMINNFNKISRWVCTEILSQTDVKNRAIVLNRFICIGHFCLQLQNYNGLMEIIAALQNSAIHRLYNTWELLPQKSWDMFQNFAVIMNSNSGAGNFEKYRTALKNVVPPCVPYLGVYLTDLTFLNDGNTDFIGEDKVLVNFTKMAKVGRVVRQIVQFQQAPYCLASIEFIKDYIINHEMWDEEVQYKKSTELEVKVPKSQRGKDTTRKKPKPIDIDFKALNIHDESADPKKK